MGTAMKNKTTRMKVLTAAMITTGRKHNRLQQLQLRGPLRLEQLQLRRGPLLLDSRRLQEHLRPGPRRPTRTSLRGCAVGRHNVLL